MNEWKRLLEQTHPKFQSLITVEEALSPLEECPTDDAEAQALADSESGANEAAERSHSEIEWISPTHKLQSKIENIPDKFGFKIGEAADYVGVKQYVLRYWESEFDILRPKKSKNGQRMYTKKDVETALIIRKLLHEDRFSIEGAQSALRKLRKQVKEKVHDQDKNSEIPHSAVSETIGNGGLEIAQSLLKSIREARASLNL
jgi:DNA-binding transcriptional MerR regulator